MRYKPKRSGLFKENYDKKKGEAMKRNKDKRIKTEMQERELAPAGAPKTWIVNCPQCGASLNLKEGSDAYLCPVCKSILHVKSGERLVKNVSKEEQTLRVNLTETAVKRLLEKEAERVKLENKRCRRKKKLAKKSAEFLDSKLAVLASEGYSKEDCFTVDVDEKGNLYVKKA